MVVKIGGKEYFIDNNRAYGDRDKNEGEVNSEGPSYIYIYIYIFYIYIYIVMPRENNNGKYSTYKGSESIREGVCI